MKVAVVIPVYKHNDMTHALMADMRRDNLVHSTFIVDNGGDYSPVYEEYVVRPGKNLYWAGGCNFGIAYAKGLDNWDAYLILNNDTRICRDMVQILYETMDDTIGLVGPDPDSVRHHVGRQRYWPFVLQKLAQEHREKKVILRGALDGCCILINAKTVEAIGLLDEVTFGKYGYSVDVDYCIRAKKAGFSIVTQQAAFLWHYHHATGATLEGGKKGLYVYKAKIDADLGMQKKYGGRWKHLCRSTSLPKDTPTDIQPTHG